MSTIISVDIETSGLVAGVNHMLSLGAAALDSQNGEIISTFSKNISPDRMLYLREDADTMNWWKQYPEAYIKATEDAYPASMVMRAFDMWISSMSVNEPRPTIAAWKPAFDIAFIRWYNEVYYPDGNKNTRYSFGLDIKTVVATALKQPFNTVKISDVPDSFKVDSNGNITPPHDHTAVGDAVEQAIILYNAMRKLGVEL